MGQAESWSVFDNLLTRNHVEKALVQPGDQQQQHNLIPMALATVMHLDGSPGQLETVYSHMRGDLDSWTVAPERISSLEERQQHLGDSRYQRAYMDFFSIQHGRERGNSKQLALSQLLQPEWQPLLGGLFGGLGHALVLLGDAVELQSALLVVESLVLAAVDWSAPLADLLAHPQLATPAEAALAPDTIVARIAYDGRFGGLMRAGPGFGQAGSRVLANPAARAALVDYVHQLDVADVPCLLDQLAGLAVLLVCGTHKPGAPAFDFYLSALPGLVHGLRSVLPSFEDPRWRLALVRGVWLVMVLSYVTQMRPVLDASLVVDDDEGGNEGREEDRSWDGLWAEFRSRPDGVEGMYLDAQFLRCLRSLHELGRAAEDDTIYLRAAWKLRRQWVGWVGLGKPKEETLNVRL